MWARSDGRQYGARVSVENESRAAYPLSMIGDHTAKVKLIRLNPCTAKLGSYSPVSRHMGFVSYIFTFISVGGGLSDEESEYQNAPSRPLPTAPVPFQLKGRGRVSMPRACGGRKRGREATERPPQDHAKTRRHGPKF